MGTIAMDWQANMALGYSVVNAVDVFPGIRYTRIFIAVSTDASDEQRRLWNVF